MTTDILDNDTIIQDDDTNIQGNGTNIPDNYIRVFSHPKYVTPRTCEINLAVKNSRE